MLYVSKVPSVSYCSTVMLYAVFNFLCLVYFIKCASQYITERILSSVITNVSISAFTKTVLFFNIHTNETEWSLACWQWAISPSCDKIWFYTCSMQHSQLFSWKCDNVRYSTVASADRTVLNTSQLIIIWAVTIERNLNLHNSLLPVICMHDF